MKKLIMISFVVIVSISNVFAQEPITDLYQYNYTSISPSFAGLDGQKITFMGGWCKACIGGIYNGGFMGYETSIDKINSGVGANVMARQLGPQNDTYIQLLYNYRFNLGEKHKLIVGTRVGMQVNTVDFTLYRPIEPGDPLLNPTVRQEKTMKLSLSALYKRERFFAGLSVDNMVQPTNDYTDGEFRYNLIVGGNYNIGNSLSVTHSLFVFAGYGYKRPEVNNSVLIKNLFIAGVSFSGDEGGFYTRANAGLRFKNIGQVVVAVYSRERDVPKDFSGQIMLQFNLGE